MACIFLKKLCSAAPQIDFYETQSCTQSLYYTTIEAIQIQSIKSYIIPVRLILILSSLLHLHILKRFFPYGFLTKTAHILIGPMHAACLPISFLWFDIIYLSTKYNDDRLYVQSHNTQSI